MTQIVSKIHRQKVVEYLAAPYMKEKLGALSDASGKLEAARKNGKVHELIKPKEWSVFTWDEDLEEKMSLHTPKCNEGDEKRTVTIYGGVRVKTKEELMKEVLSEVLPVWSEERDAVAFRKERGDEQTRGGIDGRPEFAVLEKLTRSGPNDVASEFVVEFEKQKKQFYRPLTQKEKDERAAAEAKKAAREAGGDVDMGVGADDDHPFIQQFQDES